MCLYKLTLYISVKVYVKYKICMHNNKWLYCMECPQYSTRLEALGYLCHCLSGCVQR